MTLRHQIALCLDPALKRTQGLSKTNKFLVVVILYAVVLAILETERSIFKAYFHLFIFSEYAFTMIFGIEYILRVWTCIENRNHTSRLQYIFTFTALIDLVAFASFFVSRLFGEGYILRLIRLVRIIRIAKLGRFSRAFQNILQAIYDKRYEMFISFCVAVVLLLVSSIALYLIEGHAQPVAFGSIPRAMWWSVVTLTSVGYGDVYPITPLGRVFAAITSITAIGLIALPAGILASAFSEALTKSKQK